MVIFVDTNVLLRYTQTGHPHHQIALESLRLLKAGGHDLAFPVQVAYEFWVVATRPVAQNGLELSVQRTADELEQFQTLCSVYYDDKAVFDSWRDLVTRYAVQGKPVHDARLVAAMLRHGVTHLVTFNAPDFARYAEITAVAPEAAVSLPPAD